MLWDPDAHEPLVQEPWDEVEPGLRSGRSLPMPRTPSPTAGPSTPPMSAAGDPGPWGGLYLGGAGVVDALRRLAERGLVELRRDYLPYLETPQPRQPTARA